MIIWIGKSNLMDAISFVLGVASQQLRSSNLTELIYRDGNATGSQGGKRRPLPSAKQASVSLHYQLANGTMRVLQRTVQASSGSSEYRLDGQVVSAADYQSFLESENILVKARNFLVFQGDVEAMASKSPRDLTRLVEQICG